MVTEPEYQRVHVAPIRLLQQSLSLMGREYWLFLALTLVGMLIGSVVPLVLYGPMMCGVYLCYLQRMRGKRADFETLFKGFDYFVESLIATILVWLATMVLLVPFAVLMVIVMVGAAVAGEEAGPVVLLAVFAVLVPVFVLITMIVSSLFLFVYPLIVDKQYTAMPAIAASCRAVWANLGGMLLLMIVYGVIAVIAVLPCGIGSIFFTPILFGALTVLYRQIFPEHPPLACPIS